VPHSPVSSNDNNYFNTKNNIVVLEANLRT
jgi:hypothetical protein